MLSSGFVLSILGLQLNYRYKKRRLFTRNANIEKSLSVKSIVYIRCNMIYCNRVVIVENQLIQNSIRVYSIR